MVQLSCSFATNCRTKCYFSRAGRGRTPKFVGVQHKRTFERRQCIPMYRPRRSFILARIGLFGDYEGRDFTICLKYRAQLGVRFRPAAS